MSALGHFQILTLLFRIFAKIVHFSWNFIMSREMYQNYFFQFLSILIGVYEVFDWKKININLF